MACSFILAGSFYFEISIVIIVIVVRLVVIVCKRKRASDGKEAQNRT